MNPTRADRTGGAGFSFTKGDPIKLLKTHTDESAYFGDHKVFEMITMRARSAGVAGATVVRALIGIGHTPHEQRHHVLDDDHSVIVEILDIEPRLRAFFESLSDMEHIGPATLKTVEVLDWPAANRAIRRAEPSDGAGATIAARRFEPF